MEAYKNRINNIFEKQVKPPILQEVASLPNEEAKEKAVRQIIKERFGVEIVEDKKEQEPKNKALDWIRKKAKYPLLLALGIAGVKYGDDVENIIYGGNNNKDELKKEAPVPAKKPEAKDTATLKIVPPPAVVKAPDTTKKTPDSLERGPELPKGVAKVREFFASEKSLTPGRAFIILSKASGKIFTFDDKNNLFDTAPALFGRTRGNSKNTVKKAGEGIMSTPAGPYFMSDSKTRKDAEEYEIQLSLYGKDSLGMHDVWKEEFTERMYALNTKTSLDNNATNGCINIKKEDFKKIMSLFRADLGELLIVLPEDESLVDDRYIKNLMAEAARLVVKIRSYRIGIYQGAIERHRNAGNQEAVGELQKDVDSLANERKLAQDFIKAMR